MPALPSLSASAPATFVIVVSSSALTSMVCSDPPVVVWFTRAPSAMYAWVVIDKTSTITEPVTAALPPPAPPPTATELKAGSVTLPASGAGSTRTIGLSVAFAVTDSSFATSTQVVLPVQTVPPAVPESMKARVWTDGMTFTTIAPPTALPLVESAPETAMFWRPMKLVAFSSRCRWTRPRHPCRSRPSCRS